MKYRAISNDSGNENACYTSRLAQMFVSLGRIVGYIAFIFFICASAAAQEPADPFVSPAAQLVSQIMDRAGSPGFVTLDIANQSSLSAAEVTNARKAIEAQLRAANVRLVKPERAVAEITVTMSENLRGLLWVADVKQGLTSQTIMLQFGKAASSVTTHVPALTVRRTPIFTQESGAQIVDFTLSDAKNLLVAEPERLVTYRFDSGWKQTNSFAIHHSHPWPRDLRGHISLLQAQLTLSLPGVQCSGSLAADHALTSLECTDTDDPWPLDSGSRAFFPASRNFFNGVLRGVDQSLPPFYSTATIGDSNPVWIFTGTDGRARLYFNLAQAPHVYTGWGSDVASVHSACGSLWQVLASSAGDRSQRDSIQAMEIVNREPMAVSSPLELNGTVTSMWRSPDPTAANLVTQNVTSKKYEASILSVDCSR